MMKKIAESELILNNDGSIYHLKLQPEQLADDIIVVGDPQRVEIISSYFDKIEHKVHNREFVTHTGTLNGHRLTVLATGIGTDNIDIVINELDALVNIDLQNRTIKKDHKSLNIIRIGTSGGLQADIEVDSFLASQYGLGFDGLLHYYDKSDSVRDTNIEDAFVSHANWDNHPARPYVVKCSEMLLKRIAKDIRTGITATAPGFYGPQGRVLRLKLKNPDLNQIIENFNYKDLKICNFEMETSALYGLGALLGHNTLTVCDVIANRVSKTYSKDYKKSVRDLIELVLERICQ